ncbi:hypothetical protein BC828DRAFT_418671 [Blastocladiella britannica]|nr:hypothetical protein BC828DRAFT_418671 [Blastocladiella britannica]
MPISRKAKTPATTLSKKAKVEARRKKDLLISVKKSKQARDSDKAVRDQERAQKAADIDTELDQLRSAAAGDNEDDDEEEINVDVADQAGSDDEENEVEDDDSISVEGEDDAAENAGELHEDDQITVLADADEEQAKDAADILKNREARGVVYLGRIPHGFYESEMLNYFTQFGKVTRIRLSRNKKTGGSKHYAFIEFASSSVADVVADTMDNYIMFGRVLTCRRVPTEQVHPDLFKGANTTFRAANLVVVAQRKSHTPKSREEVTKTAKRLIATEKQKVAKCAELGIVYDWEAVSYAKLARDAGLLQPAAAAAATAPASPAKPAAAAKSVVADDKTKKDAAAPAPKKGKQAPAAAPAVAAPVAAAPAAVAASPPKVKAKKAVAPVAPTSASVPAPSKAQKRKADTQEPETAPAAPAAAKGGKAKKAKLAPGKKKASTA